MPLTMISRFTWLGFVLSSSLLSGCLFVGDFDDYFEPAPEALTYEVCYSSANCLPGDTCEEIALPAGLYTDYVNAVCTFQCFDALDCPVSEFNLLPGACVEQAFLGAANAGRICLERCELDADCDVGAGFGCEVIVGERLCVPVR